MIKTIYSVNETKVNSKLQKDILIPPVIALACGDVNEAMVKEVAKSFDEAHNTGQSMIPLIVDTYGGSVYACLGIVDIIRSAKLSVATICNSKAMSAGSIILSCGTKGMRYASPNCTIMFHDVASFAMGKLTDLENDLVETRRLSNLLFNVMSKACGHYDPKYFQNILNKNSDVDMFMTPQQAKKHKIIDHIGSPSLHVDIKTSYQLHINK